MLNIDKISFIKNQCETVIRALQTALYDEKSDKEQWLDDFTSDIDSLDAFCYSYLSNFIGG